MDKQATIKWNPFTKGYLQDPYPHINACRNQNPFQIGLFGLSLVFDYQSIHEILRSEYFSVPSISNYFVEHESYIFKNSNQCPYLSQTLHKWPIYLNPPEHTSVRNTLARSFEGDLTPLVQQSLQQSMQYTLTDEIDLIKFCRSFVGRITASLLDIEYLDLGELDRLSMNLAQAQDILIPAQKYRAINSVLLEHRSTFDQSRFTKELIANYPEEHDESVRYSLLTTSLMAFYETSKNAFILSLFEILKNSALKTYVLKANEKEMSVLVEELLRWISIIQYTSRVCSKTCVINDKMYHEGTTYFLCIASANRDPEIFDQPDVLQPRRQPNPHLTFAAGKHNCLGSGIARMELRSALQPMVQYLSDYSVDIKSVNWYRQTIIRSAKSIQITRK